MTDSQLPDLDLKYTIARLSRLLADANLQLANFAGLCDQLLEEREELTSDPPSTPPRRTAEEQ